MADEDYKEAYVSVKDKLSSWDAGPFEFSLARGFDTEPGVWTFRATWSTPAPARPVPQCVVHMFIKCPQFGATNIDKSRYSFEADKHEFSEGDITGSAGMLQVLLQRYVQRKGRDLAFLDVTSAFDRTRLPRTYAVDPAVAAEEASAVRIQAIARGKRDRARVLSKRQQRQRDDAASRIGKIGKGKAARKRVAELKEQKEQEAAAVQIQRIGRSKYAKKKVAEKRRYGTRSKGDAGDADTEGLSEDDAATKLQSIQRGRLARERVEAKRRELMEQQEAATRVQSIARGKRDRERVARIKAEKAGA